MAGGSVPLYKRGNVWWVRIGKHTRQSTGTTDRRQAEEYERNLAERLWRQRKLGDRSAHTWAEATDRWLRDSRKQRRRDRELLAWLAPRLDKYSVGNVADSDVLEELRRDGLESGWVHATVDRMMRTVRSVLRACWKWKWLEAPPHVPMYGESDDDPEPRFLTQEQFAQLCAELPDHLALAARFAVATLLRKSAQARLTWPAVDFEHATAQIPRRVQKGGKPFGLTLSVEAIKILRQAKVMHPGSERCFNQGDFRTAAFKKAASRIGIQALRWHDLRHTGASWAVQNGVSLPELMLLGDWKSYRSVLIYARFAPSHAAAAAKVVGTKVAQALKGKSKKA